MIPSVFWHVKLSLLLFTLLVVIRKPADRPDVAVSLDRDLTRTQGVVQSLVQDAE